MHITVRPVESAADRKAFVELAFRLNADDPNWVPPLKREVYDLITPGKNPWFDHAEAQFFIAERDGCVVGRISAHMDHLALAQPAAQGMGPGTGNWGMMEAQDEAVFQELIARAEDWLRTKGMRRSLGPFSLSVWDEVGLQVSGFDHPPTVMMGHHRPEYAAWIEAAGYSKAKDLYTYELDIRPEMGPLMARLVGSAERNPRIRIRGVDKAHFDQEVRIILNLLNDAWSDNWGFVPLTEAEIAYAGKKLKPIIFNELVRIAEVDGEPVAFMLTIPDVNELTRDLNGELFPFNFIKLLWRLRKPRTRRLRVPLMGVARSLHNTRLASQLAFMMIEFTRRDAVSKFGATHGEFGWILEDNKGMLSIAQLPGASINHRYRIYEKAL